MKQPSVNDKELSRFLHVALDAAARARKVHAQYFKKLSNIQSKRDLSLVSEADQNSEKAIRELLRKKFPKINILGEEEGLESHKDTRGRWLVDPLDGTTNYIHGYPFFCSSIALEMDGEVKVGVIDSMILKKTYWAVRGHGAYVNNKKIHVSSAERLVDGLIATGFLTYGGDNLGFQINVFKRFVESTRGVRRSGSAALEMAFLAEGALDGFWEYGLKAWDTGAGSLLVSEAGGRVTNLEGKTFHPDDRSIIASNGLIHDEFLHLIQSGVKE